MSLQLCDATKTHDWFQAVALSLAEEIFFNSVSSSKQCSVPLLLEAFLVKPPLNRSKLLLIGIICIIQKSASFVETSLWMLLGKKKRGACFIVLSFWLRIASRRAWCSYAPFGEAAIYFVEVLADSLQLWAITELEPIKSIPSFLCLQVKS